MDNKFLEYGQNTFASEGRREHAKVVDAFEHCTKLYNNVNNKYDDLPYSNHIRMVAATAVLHFSDQTSEEQAEMLIACFGHDLIEDARISYGYLKYKYGLRVAELIYSVTDNTGRDRASKACYDKIRSCKGATYLKLCDRFANSMYSKLTGSVKFKVYTSEFADFRSELYSQENRNKTLWDELDYLFCFKKNSPFVPINS